MTTERLDSLLATGARYSDSTLKKHHWVLKLYSAFATAFTLQPWPLDPVIVSGFIRFLGLEAKYAVGSIEDVIIPSLKRINTEKTGIPPSNELHQYMAQALKDVKNSKTHLNSPEGKEPAIVTDVKRIIELTPPGVPT
jgi:hypothetical protein